jgi:hypothetical protein
MIFNEFLKGLGIINLKNKYLYWDKILTIN